MQGCVVCTLICLSLPCFSPDMDSLAWPWLARLHSVIWIRCRRWAANTNSPSLGPLSLSPHFPDVTLAHCFSFKQLLWGIVIAAIMRGGGVIGTSTSVRVFYIKCRHVFLRWNVPWYASDSRCKFSVVSLLRSLANRSQKTHWMSSKNTLSHSQKKTSFPQSARSRHCADKGFSAELDRTPRTCQGL